LSGYGVEMALKKTDYLVVDDRQTSARGAGEEYRQADPFEDVLGADPWSEPALRKGEARSESPVKAG
jgi:UDP-glucose:glycoprotein glucosyltransferase